MAFGIGDLFGILTGAGFLAKEGMKANREWSDAIERNELICQFVQKYTNRELEENLRQDILDPAKYDEIWERIESYKAQKGKWYRWNSDHPAWQAVGLERKPFRTATGNLRARSQYQDTVLNDNRKQALFMLMHTYGKMTIQNATQEARMASDEMLRNWIVKHPAEY